MKNLYALVVCVVGVVAVALAFFCSRTNHHRLANDGSEVIWMDIACELIL